jgi:hypothetical protein
MAEFGVVWNDEELEWLLNSLEGPVGQLMVDLSEKTTAAAIAGAPVQTPRTFSWGKKHSTSYMPWSGGYAKSGTYAKAGYSNAGKLYGGTNSPLFPTYFLERQCRWPHPHELHPFLTNSLLAIEL